MTDNPHNILGKDEGSFVTNRLVIINPKVMPSINKSKDLTLVDGETLLFKNNAA